MNHCILDMMLCANFVGATPSEALSDVPPPPGSGNDCGTCALFVLAHTLGKPVSLEEVRRKLPTVPASGHSMLELKRAAAGLGLPLTGVQLGSHDGVIDRPMLVSLRRGQHGHFLVIRPVGTTGKRVQVIDSTRPPDVMDVAGLFASPEWTGVALVPARPSEPSRWCGLLLATSGLILGVGTLLPRKLATLLGRMGRFPLHGAGKPPH